MFFLRRLWPKPVVKQIVCLANSRKRGGHCVAGKECAHDGSWSWVRPVSARPDEELSERERQYLDGGEPQLLEVIDVPLRRARPRACQVENWLIDSKRRWKRVDQAGWDTLRLLADDPETLWLNGASTYNGLNDRVGEGDAASLAGSLVLLHLEDLKLFVSAPGAKFGDSTRRVQASFTNRGVPYRLRVTDPVVEQTYLARRDGNFPIGECFATISLSEPFQGYRYKLVAGLMMPPAVGS